jgi:hypothetical protein
MAPSATRTRSDRKLRKRSERLLMRDLRDGVGDEPV